MIKREEARKLLLIIVLLFRRLKFKIMDRLEDLSLKGSKMGRRMMIKAKRMTSRMMR